MLKSDVTFQASIIIEYEMNETKLIKRQIKIYTLTKRSGWPRKANCAHLKVPNFSSHMVIMKVNDNLILEKVYEIVSRQGRGHFGVNHSYP